MKIDGFNLLLQDFCSYCPDFEPEVEKINCTSFGEAEIKEFKDGKWITCPFCHKKLIKIFPDTKIHKMPYICKSSKCGQSFIVNVE